MSETISADEYRNEIEQMAENVRDAVEEWDEDEAEVVFSVVDSHEWIIYTDYHLDILRHAEEDPEDWNHLVHDSNSHKEVLQCMAFDAMRKDLYNELRS